jgi:hydroxymethylbilane synthase
MRGNVDTRLRKLDEGNCDAIVLSAAGLRRLGYEDRITQYLAPDFVLPAVGQGALAIESRSDDDEVNSVIGRLDHHDTRIACEAERAFLRGLGGGCLVPIAAFAEVNDSSLRLRGLVASPDGSKVLTGSRSAATRSAAQVGLALAEEMLASGAKELLAAG